MSILQFRFADYRFKPSWLGVVLTICCIPLFIKLGLWQQHKAEQKLALQARYEQYDKQAPARLPATVAQPEQWRYRPVEVSGVYLPQYQILLDNQVDGERVGYHVITPLQVDGSRHVVLVNRGWIAAADNHSQLPAVTTPTGRQLVAGKVWVPTSKFYTLQRQQSAASESATGAWQSAWQNMDMPRYQSSVPFAVLPVVIRLDPASTAGGFVRNWVMPDDRVATNIGYAYQWFGFAAAALVIFIVVSFKKNAASS